MPARSTFPSPIPADEVRRLFVEFYRGKPAPGAGGHAVVPSSPVVPHDDPTLLFANAGMNQFKPIFLGQAAPGSALAGLKRAVNSQKCIRAGGKHNDLEDVGRDTYHHTFFEMLGTWSFGDYYKKESIAWGMELLTGVYGIPAERLYATYFRGEPEAGLEPDLEARDLWLGHLPASNVLPGGFKDNFWEMGETGPCGPCSEIHFDRVGARNAARLVNAGDPNVLEVWNHVFIGFNREEGGGLRALPARHIDTGMGLERLVSVLQGKPSNYDTDLFTPLFMAIERITGARPYMGRLGAQDKDNIDTAYRVIADHARALTFALTDGAVPSNEGRGYVLRRILRRAVRYGRQTLGAKPGFFAQLVPVVVERMGGFFPELKQNPQRVMDVVREEEESFGRTLERGLRLFEEAVGGGGGGQVPGEVAFKLHDTYGFPVDLTQLMAEERGMRVDLGGYERLMAEAKEKARAGSAGRFAAGVGPGGGGPLVLGPEAIAQLQRLGVARTDDVDKYHGREVRATVRAIYNGENFDEHVRAGNQTRAVGIVLDRTNFYASSGGQPGDMGLLEAADGRRVAIAGTIHPEGDKTRVVHVP
ncbi:MAG TPA: alanine--tRNA ligase, partial [Phycisphaerales bacterium]|nr:alanine--tRNA ligase [Phycisphaerales bacterium]